MGKIIIPESVERKLEDGEKPLAKIKTLKFGGFVATNRRLFRVNKDLESRILDYSNVSIKSRRPVEAIAAGVVVTVVTVIAYVFLIIIGITGDMFGVGVTAPKIWELLFVGLLGIGSVLGFSLTSPMVEYRIENTDVSEAMFKRWILHKAIINVRQVNKFIGVLEGKTRPISQSDIGKPAPRATHRRL